ncbi:reticulon-like protein B9 [Juglans microcarpa x Juglans regia]|uniref:reticulon-like protein B9 n=1 Tax=Juglans microcarpa x Juglans regia TaxID=2249226 RepID=UPI001B7EB9FA|nr:reticulon-like protein B9 [Juglans microcarpa x Juglans regia]
MAQVRHSNLFLGGRSVHEALGGGKVADVLLWSNESSRTVSAALLIGMTVLWFLFEVAEYNLVTFLCHIIITTMLVFFIWTSIQDNFNWKIPPNIHDPMLRSYSEFREVASTLLTVLNEFLPKLLNIAYERDLRRFLSAILSLYILSVVGSYFSFLNLIYFGFLCMETLPLLYDKFRYQVDNFVEEAMENMKGKYNAFDSKFLNKIPRGHVKEKEK